MATFDVIDLKSKKVSSIELADEVFGAEPNPHLIYEVTKMQQINRRAGTVAVKNSSLVSGGGKKPWKQKGTGRARQGSTRSPQWRGGGVALGPKPRSYEQRTPKKMKRLALRSALSDRAGDDKVIVVDAWSFDSPSTKTAVEALAKLGVEGRALIVLEPTDVAAWKSFRNLPSVHVLTIGELNTYDVLVSDYVVFTSATLPGVSPSDSEDAQ